MALQAHHSLYRNVASGAGVLVSERLDDDHPSFVLFPLLSFPGFSGVCWGPRRII